MYGSLMTELRSERRYLFPYPGMKTNRMSLLSPFFPEYRQYVSVFGGSATDLLAQRADEEVFNDRDEQLYNLISVFKNARQKARLRDLIKATPYSQRAFDAALLSLDCNDPITKAHAFLVAQYQSARAQLHAERMYSSCWDKKQNKSYINRWKLLPSGIDYFAERFANVTVHRWDFRQVISDYGVDGTFLFLDPPYHPDTINDTFYVHTMSARDHREMLSLLLRCHHKAKIMLVGYSNKDYENYLQDWYFVPLQVTYGGTSSQNKKGTLGVWMSYWHERQSLYATA